MIIAIEGADAVGKHTQVERLAERFRAANRTVTVFSFPRYDSPTGKAIRRHLHGEIGTWELKHGAMATRAPEDALVFQCVQLADKIAALAEMRAATADGSVVILDRWWQSGAVYGAIDGLPEDWNATLTERLPAADLNILIDLDPTEAARRRPELRDRYEKDRELQARVRQGYLDLWRARVRSLPGWHTVDGAPPVDEVARSIFTVTMDHLLWMLGRK